MKKAEDLKKDLRRGDYPLLVELTGVALQTINAFFQGHRNTDTPKGRKVLEAAEKLVESRKQLKASLEASEPGDVPSRACA